MRLILVLVLIYMLIRTFMNYILPYMVKGAIAEAEDEAKRRQQKNKVKEGTHITHIPPKKEGFDGGEYIDYEEVK